MKVRSGADCDVIAFFQLNMAGVDGWIYIPSPSASSGSNAVLGGGWDLSCRCRGMGECNSRIGDCLGFICFCSLSAACLSDLVHVTR